MRKLSNKLATMALGLMVLGGGQLVPRHAVAEDSAWKLKTLPGAATAKSIGTAIKSGMAKVGDAIRPSPKEAPDPISLSTKVNPSPELFLSMATVAEESGNVEGARKHYEQALELAPKRLDVILPYARFQDRHKEWSKATELYQRAARSNPDDPSVFNDLGLCFARRSMLPQSISALERAIQLAPERRLYRNNIATVLVEMGDVDAAFGHLKAVHEEAVAYYNLGYLMLQSGEPRAAERLFSEALAKNPSLVEAKIWLRKLESNGAKPQNARRPTPQMRSADRQAPQSTGIPELSMRPSRAQTTDQGRQFRPLPDQSSTIIQTPAVGPPLYPEDSAPLPRTMVVPEGRRPFTRPSFPVRTTVSGPSVSGRPVPVLQPLPPVDR